VYALALAATSSSTFGTCALIGLAIGFLVAPFQAFHRLRIERDLARSQAQGQYGVAQLLMPQRYVNAISGGSWSVDAFEPVNEAAFVVRGIIGAYPPDPHSEVESTLLDRFRETAASSAIDLWLRGRFVEVGSAQKWQLVSPSNGFEFAVERTPFVLESGGSEIRVRCLLVLPRGGINITAPRALIDLIARDLPKEPTTSAPSDPFTLFELAAEPFRPDLNEIVDAIAETLVVEIAPVLFPPLLHRSRRERTLARLGLKPRLRLIGPNFDIRSKPRPLTVALTIAEFPRLPGGTWEANDLLVQTPTKVAPDDRERRHELLRREFRAFLRQHQYRDFEASVAAIAGTAPAPILRR
jgi:hypothetical protein